MSETTKCSKVIAPAVQWMAGKMVEEQISLDVAVDAFRLSLVRNAIKSNGAHHGKAAKSLRVHRNTVTRILSVARTGSQTGSRARAMA